MTRKNRLAALAAAAVVAVGGAPTAAAETLQIAGSSTVYPFSTVVAERYGRAHDHAVNVQATGTGGGFKNFFCQGRADIANASRQIKKSEIELCAQNGVRSILEVKIGYDGIVVAQAIDAPVFDLTRAQLFAALAKDAPDENGRSIDPNPHRVWRDIAADLPNSKIEVLGPPPTSGTRDAFVELVMEIGCEEFAVIESLSGEKKKAACQAMREDGAFVEAGENDNLIIQKISSNPAALGIFGFSFLEENRDRVRGLAIDGFLPTFEAVADGSYPVSRPLFFYVNIDKMKTSKALAGFVDAFVAEAAIGDDGYLVDRGLIPLPPSEREALLRRVRAREKLSL